MTRPIQLSSQAIIRPADTTAYTSGDLVANSTTAGSVTPFLFAGDGGGDLWLHSMRLFSSNTAVANKNFRMLLFSSAPTVSAGDNGALAVTAGDLIGVVGSTAALGAVAGAPAVNNLVSQDAAGTFVRAMSIGVPPKFWGLLQVLAAYVPASGETFRAVAELAVDA